MGIRERRWDERKGSTHRLVVASEKMVKLNFNLNQVERTRPDSVWDGSENSEKGKGTHGDPPDLTEHQMGQPSHILDGRQFNAKLNYCSQMLLMQYPLLTGSSKDDGTNSIGKRERNKYFLERKGVAMTTPPRGYWSNRPKLAIYIGNCILDVIPHQWSIIYE